MFFTIIMGLKAYITTREKNKDIRTKMKLLLCKGQELDLEQPNESFLRDLWPLNRVLVPLGVFSHHILELLPIP